MAIKQFLKNNWILILLGIMIIFGFFKFFENQNYIKNYAWENLEVCNYQDMLTYQDFENGKNCRLQDCTLKDMDFLIELNMRQQYISKESNLVYQKVDYTQAKVMECFCPVNNKTINMICVERLSNKGLEKLKGWKKWS